MENLADGLGVSVLERRCAQCAAGWHGIESLTCDCACHGPRFYGCPLHDITYFHGDQERHTYTAYPPCDLCEETET